MRTARVLVIFFGLSFVLGACEAVEDTPNRGVNLAGADFGFNTLPGVYGQHYTYPTEDEGGLLHG